MTIRTSEVIHRWMGWCPNTPMTRIATVLPAEKSENIHQPQPGGGAGVKERIRQGTGIAVQSIKTLIHNKQLLWFSFLAGLVILIMTFWESAFIIYSSSLHFGSYSYWSFGYKSGLILTFVIEIISIFCLNFLLASLLLSFQSDNTESLGKVRKGLSLAKSHVQSITGWSFILALLGTAIYTIIVHHPYFGHLYPAMVTFTLYLPFVYYIPDILLSAMSFVFIKMFVNVFLFILTLFVIPVIVLENKNLPDAVTGSISYLKNTWIEIVICFFIFSLIMLGISLLDPVIRMTPAFAGYDYHFFSVYSIEMALICILFLLGWWITSVIGFTVAGIAIKNLYTLGKTGQMPGNFSRPTASKIEPAKVESRQEI
ncbi:MAG: hypothetical protein PHV39_08945 [Methanomicrobium sp.]|nr:hypothetical protein [Methanomicrobium sp.]